MKFLVSHKANIAYYFLLLYAFLLIRPIVPFVKDAIGHSFSQAVHIATVHAVYGENHVEKETAYCCTDTEKNKSAKTISAEDNIPIHITSEHLLSQNGNSSTGIKFPSFYNLSLSSVFISNIAPPPKFS